jgi:hypothetical protein
MRSQHETGLKMAKEVYTMSEHLSECELLEPCGADTPEHGFCSRQQTYCIHCERACICKHLRACEIRVIGAAVQRVEAFEYITTVGVTLSSVVAKAAIIAEIKFDDY